MSDLFREDQERSASSVPPRGAEPTAEEKGAPAVPEMTLAFQPAGIAVCASPVQNGSAANAIANELTLADEPLGKALNKPPDTAHDGALGTIEQQPKKEEPEKEEPAPNLSGDTIGFSEARNEAPSAATPGHTIDFRAAAAGAADPSLQQLNDTIGVPQERPGKDETKKWPTIPGYEIMGELGRGAMGVVYKARQKRLNRLVALKMMLAGSHAGAEQLARFQTEAEAVARLQNSNIVQIYEVGEHEDLPFFSLEFVDGGTLHNQLGGKPQPARDAARMIETLAMAMNCAHELNVIHRDLKPANILMTANGILKISDFGLAKRIEEDSSQTRSGTLMGTPSYMSPEQASGDTHAIGPPADQYALGAMLYEMLTGRPPFQGTSILDTLEQVRTHEPVPPSRLQPSVPRDLETICLKCLQKETRKRYASCGDLAEDLRLFQAGEPIKARPVGNVERAWRWCKRNPRVAILSAAIAVLLTMSGTLIVGATVRAAQERETLTEAGKLGEQRLQQTTEAMQQGRYRHAQVLLRWSDPLVESSPALAEVRDHLHLLRDQVKLYADFKELMDRARYYGLFSQNPKEAQRACRGLLSLYDEIEQKSGRGSCGLPPLDAEQDKLLKEEFFEAFLVSAQVEWAQSGAGGDAAAKHARGAIALLDRAEKIYPQAWTLYSRRSDWLGKVGDSKRAEQDLQRARSLAPTSPLDRFWYGMALHQEGTLLEGKDRPKAKEKYHRAIREYAALLRVRPDHFWAYFDGAVCQFALGNADAAVINFTTCLQLRPEAVWPSFPRGKILQQQKQFAAAAEDFSRALEFEPKNASIYSDRGSCYLALGDFARARGDFAKVIDLRANDAAAYRMHGLASVRLFDFDAAHRDWRQLAKLSPKNPEPFQFDAITYKGELKYEQALAAIGQAIRLEPKNPSFRLMRAQIYHQQGKLKDALNELEFSLEKMKVSNAGIYDDYGDLLRTLGRHADALAAYRKSAKLQPKQNDAYAGMAFVHLQKGETDSIERILAEMKSASGGSFTAHIRSAEFRRACGRWQQALADCEQASKLEGKSLLPALVRASIRAAQGEFRQAVADAASLIKGNPGNGHVLCAAAAVWSLAAQAAQKSGAVELAREYRERAAELLTDSMKKGFLDMNYQAFNRILVDPALATVREDPRVQDLLPVLRVAAK
jgi:eukaryotic-like serine/threonine-protein kinase